MMTEDVFIFAFKYCVYLKSSRMPQCYIVRYRPFRRVHRETKQYDELFRLKEKTISYLLSNTAHTFRNATVAICDTSYENISRKYDLRGTMLHTCSPAGNIRLLCKTSHEKGHKDKFGQCMRIQPVSSEKYTFPLTPK